MRCAIALVLALSSPFAAPARGQDAEKPPAPALEVLARYRFAEGASDVGDVRWASKDSIYVAYHDGIAEVGLSEGLPLLRPVLPPNSDARYRLGPLQHLATSGDHMVAADAGMTLLWGDPGDAPHTRAESASKHGAFHDLDVRGDSVVIFGVADSPFYEKSHGGILWKSSLSKGLDQWEVLYERKEVERDFSVLISLLGPGTGSLRFQKDGSLVLAPNVFPGVYLFSPSGKLKKVWAPEDLWGAAEPAWSDGRVEEEGLNRFLEHQRVIDDVLALPGGPAIIVHEPKGPPRWRLGVLGPEIQWYDIPVGHMSKVARLRGDVDAKGRIVITGGPRELYDSAHVAETEVLVAVLPD